ncbi:MAG: hypothetical protein Q8T11_18085 [Elusimicrobiota bacterium]|nr:hypothetical protein [Elusimicrobiota bacterium]
MSDLGPIVIDRHAYKLLWPALGVWLLLFIAAGDAWPVLRRQAALAFGTPVEAVVLAKRTERVRGLGRVKRNVVEFSYSWGGRRLEARQVVAGARWAALKAGSRRPAHVLRGAAFLDDDLGYSRWKLGLFGAAFAALWLWAAARRRFG